LLPSDKKIYFASDFHLGIPDHTQSLQREKRIVRWLDEIKADAAEIYLVGDLFDFWFEYRTVVPKGFVRLLGKLAELSDSGIKIYAFHGNHDMWMFGYFEEELNIPVYKAPVEREWNGKKFYIGHGDGLGPGDHGYKFIRKLFRNRVCQWLFGFLHPTAGMAVSNYFSHSSRSANSGKDNIFLGEEKEWLLLYAREMEMKKHFDFYIFGHRHLPLDLAVNNSSRYINLGDWIRYNTYAVFNGETLELKTFE
jgi:UDP-2,3-diacylglucosamine hydrolase